MTMSLLLQLLAIYLATSATAGLTLGVALGVMIRGAERRHRQYVALLMRSRTPSSFSHSPSDRVGSGPPSP